MTTTLPPIETPDTHGDLPNHRHLQPVSDEPATRDAWAPIGQTADADPQPVTFDLIALVRDAVRDVVREEIQEASRYNLARADQMARELAAREASVIADELAALDDLMERRWNATMNRLWAVGRAVESRRRGFHWFRNEG